MVSPEFFRVEYAINPFMKTETGELKKVDVPKAVEQWKTLKKTYESLGLDVAVLPGRANLPDMVFAANQCFPFGEREVLMSRMRAPQRQPEVELFKKWFDENGFKTHALQSSYSLEGNGDLLIHPGSGVVMAGYGPRTDKEVFHEISERFSLNLVPLELVHPFFYHLDTCLTVLSDRVAALVPQAFTQESLKRIGENFEQIIEIDEREALNSFAGNAHCPNGKDVILAKGSEKFCEKLRENGFKIHQVDVSEFHKSGGSVFCLKMMLT